MRRAKVLPLAIAGLIAVPAAQGQQQDPGDPLTGPTACSTVVTQAWGVRRPPRNSADVWVECNFEVTRLTLRANRQLARVGRAPILYRPDPGDQLTCRRRGRRAAACSGDAGNDVRIRVPMRVAGNACKRPPLRIRVRASGGLDCDGQPCPAIGLAALTNAELDCG
jgi:hypothetical protein